MSDRRRRRDDRFLEWKVWMFCIAGILALGGIYLDERWLTGAAIAVLTSAMLLRFVPGAPRVEVDDDEGEETTAEGEPGTDEPEEAGSGM